MFMNMSLLFFNSEVYPKNKRQPLKILTGKKHPQIKLKRFKKV